MAGKYTPLEHYLRDLPASQREVTIPFDQIERILNDKLPSSAHQYQAWWANQKKGSHVEAQAWLDPGWKVDTVNFNQKWVRFRREKPSFDYHIRQQLADEMGKEKKMTIVDNRYRGKKEYSLVYAELIIAAKYRGTVTYQEVAQIMGLPLQGSHMGMEVGWILGEISEDETAHGRPMLSAIAVSVGGNAGPGFFTLARDLGKLTHDDEQGFWEAECQAVYETWKTELRK